VTTTAGQTYNGTVALGVDHSLSASEATINGTLNANHHSLGVNGDASIGVLNAGQSVTELPQLTVSGATVLNSTISGQSVLQLAGHSQINAPNVQVSPLNRVPFARDDFRTWVAGVLIYDGSAPAALWSPTGQSVPAEDLFRRILGGALPQPKRGDPKQVEGEPGRREVTVDGYNLGSTDPAIQEELRIR